MSSRCTARHQDANSSGAGCAIAFGSCVCGMRYHQVAITASISMSALSGRAANWMALRARPSSPKPGGVDLVDLPELMNIDQEGRDFHRFIQGCAKRRPRSAAIWASSSHVHGRGITFHQLAGSPVKGQLAGGRRHSVRACLANKTLRRPDVFGRDDVQHGIVLLRGGVRQTW